MTLSISAIAGPPASTATRTTAPTGIFALSLAQVTAAPVAGHDADNPPAGDPKAKDDGDDRQDDAADGNGLPPPVQGAPDASLLAALLPPPVSLSIAPSVAAPAAAASTTSTVDAASTTGTVDAALAAASPPASAVAPVAAMPTDAPVVPAPAADVTPAAVGTFPPPSSPTLPLPGDPPIASGDARAGPPTTTPSPASPSGALPLTPAVAEPASAALDLAMSPEAASPTISPPPIPPVAIARAPAPSPSAGAAIIALAAPVSTTGGTIDTTQPVATTSAPTADTAPVASPVQIDSRSAPVVALSPAAPPTSLQGVAGNAATTTSAIQAFGAAMRAGLAKGPRPDGQADGAPGTLAGTATSRADQIPAVAATGDAQQAPLDLRREQWPHAMIDRIEALRDAADATSTQIRVVPDALGPVEMSVRKEGDTLHVHFTADQAATRAMLTEAQPRLAAIAEQRGLRLGGSTVDGGSTNAGTGQQQQQQATRQPTAPAPSTLVTATTADDDDTRLA